MTLGTVCHFHAERHALPGFIEAAKAMFDEVVLVSSPMDGTPHCEESLKIARDSGCKVILDTLSQGFGALRTRCIAYSSCDWVAILDADEVVHMARPRMNCTGTDKFPESKNPDLRLEVSVDIVNQYNLLRALMTQAEAEGSLAICLPRRHWMTGPEATVQRPAQNWISGDPDWQLRLVRNSQFLFYEHPMHERLLDTRTWSEPKFLRSSEVLIDHYAHHYRAMEPEQNTEDISTYEQLAPGCTASMWINFQPKA